MNRTILYKDSSDGPPDGYADKLVKYIPGEVTAFYIPAYALASDFGRGAIYFTLVVCVLGMLVYLSLSADKERKPRKYFYLLSIIAFAAWALATSTVGAVLFGLPEGIGAFAVLMALFILPGLDQIMTKYWD